MSDAQSPRPATALPAELTIYTVTDCRTQYLGWLDRPAADGEPLDADVLRVDAAGVTDVDAAGVQLLLSLGHALAGQQRRLLLADAPEVLQRACRVLGAADLLDTGTGHTGQAVRTEVAA